MNSIPKMQGFEADSAAIKQRLLIVDDQPLNIQTLYQIFASTYQVFMATSGKQALAMCKNTLPDIVLLDIEMPEMNGYEVCRRLKADPTSSHVPVIFISGHHKPTDEANGLGVGAVDFVAKPVNPRIIQARVKNHLNLKAQHDLLHEWVYVDGLTGVKNRRYFDEYCSAEYGRAKRNHSALSIIMLDVDFFKLYNDFYGHLKGDECLRTVATQLNNKIVRAGDLFARYGGEEFVCLLPETNLFGALKLAELLRKDVLSLQIPHEPSTLGDHLTVSLGVGTKTTYNDEDCAESLLTHADAQLYLAKKQGRNQACGAELGN